MEKLLYIEPAAGSISMTGRQPLLVQASAESLSPETGSWYIVENDDEP